MFLPSKPATSDNVRAGLFMLASMAAFVVNDTFVKLASADLQAPQIMAVRGLMATALLFAVATARGAFRPGPTFRHRAVIVRTLAEIAGTTAYIAGLSRLPIANASAIFQALPLAVTVGAALFLGEAVGWRRWTATTIGFAGVLIIVRPGAGDFSVFSLAILAAVAFSALRDLATRRMPRDMPSLYVSAVSTLAVCVTGWMLVPVTGWVPLRPEHYGFLACASAAITLGNVFIVMAMRLGDVGFVAPFRYSILVYALLIGFVLFGDPPNAFVLLGSAIVVGSGAYSLYRENLRGRLMPQRTQLH